MTVKAIIIRGYGAASGKKGDARYPEGTLKQQAPLFKARGIALEAYFMGTLNLDISPLQYEIGTPKHFVEGLDWTPHIPPENFYFFDITLHYGEADYEGLVYLPDPETKVEHQHQRSTLEVLLPKIDALEYDTEVSLTVDPEQLKLH